MDKKVATTLAVVISVVFIGVLVSLAQGNTGWKVNPHIFSPLSITSTSHGQAGAAGNAEAGVVEKGSLSGASRTGRSDSRRPAQPAKGQGHVQVQAQSHAAGPAQAQSQGRPQTQPRNTTQAGSGSAGGMSNVQPMSSTSPWKPGASKGNAPSQAVDPDVQPKGQSRVPSARSQRVPPTPPVATPNPGMGKTLNQHKWGHGKWGNGHSTPHQPQFQPQGEEH